MIVGKSVSKWRTLLLLVQPIDVDVDVEDAVVVDAVTVEEPEPRRLMEDLRFGCLAPSSVAS